MTNNWNRKKAKDLLIVFCCIAMYCVIAIVLGLPCPLKWISGISCPGCGMSRSFLALLRLDFSDALYYHPMVFYLVFATPLMIYFHLRDKNKLTKVLLLVSAGIMIIVYFVRMFILHSPVLQFSPDQGLIGQILSNIRNAKT